MVRQSVSVVGHVGHRDDHVGNADLLSTVTQSHRQTDRKMRETAWGHGASGMHPNGFAVGHACHVLRSDIIRSRCRSVGEERVAVIPAERLIPSLHTEADALRQPLVLVGIHHVGRNIEGRRARRNDARVGLEVQVWASSMEKHTDERTGTVRQREG